MAHKTIIACGIIWCCLSGFVFAQNASYQISPYPDIWFNSVDGVRLGVRVLGEMEGSFKDGPHRIDAGIWLGTKLPVQPISYYFSYTTPIPTISSYMNEGSVQVISSVRTGYSFHRLQLNKRWQRGFQELNYIEGSLFVSKQGHFEPEYVPYRYLWDFDWLTMVGANFLISEKFERSQFFADITLQSNVDANSEAFSNAQLEVLYVHNFSSDFKLRLRNFSGFSSKQAHTEFNYLATNGTPESWMQSGFSRANGTIPKAWLNAGFIHFDGGSNLRGYQAYMSDLLELTDQSNGTLFEFPLHDQVIAFNAEFEFPNPLHNKLTRIKYLGELIEFRSYTFFDVSRGKGSSVLTDPNTADSPAIVPPKIESVFKSEQWLADAGVGFQFSINIPDYLGKDRGAFVRYELPLWLSSTTNNDSNFKFRNIIGFGAIFNF